VKGFFYWLLQRPRYWIAKKYADYVFVTSEPDVTKFPKQAKLNKVVVVRGGVDITESKRYLKANKNSSTFSKKYDACFVGRFHPQKGVLELIDIWRNVVDIKKNARLAMIGNGDLEFDVKKKITDYNLGRSIDLLGFMDGKEKYNIFKQSNIIIHPAVYDSGGMAACEGMAWGLPGVSFDLEALKTYYPKGMIKTPCFDKKKFAENIINLLLIFDS